MRLGFACCPVAPVLFTVGTRMSTWRFWLLCIRSTVLDNLQLACNSVWHLYTPAWSFTSVPLHSLVQKIVISQRGSRSQSCYRLCVFKRSVYTTSTCDSDAAQPCVALPYRQSDAPRPSRSYFVEIACRKAKLLPNALESHSARYRRRKSHVFR